MKNIKIEDVIAFIENAFEKKDLVSITKINNHSWICKSKLQSELKKEKEELYQKSKNI